MVPRAGTLPGEVLRRHSCCLRCRNLCGVRVLLRLPCRRFFLPAQPWQCRGVCLHTVRRGGRQKCPHATASPSSLLRMQAQAVPGERVVQQACLQRGGVRKGEEQE